MANTSASFKYKSVVLTVEMCVGHDWCEKDQEVMKQAIDYTTMFVYGLFEYIDFQKRDGRPVFQKVDYLTFKRLNHMTNQLKNLYLKRNTYDTFDGLINLDWPTHSGSFYNLEDSWEFDVPVVENNQIFAL